jgi:hypothetical protein
VEVGVIVGVGAGVGSGEELGVGDGLGLGVADGEGRGVGDGVGCFDSSLFVEFIGRQRAGTPALQVDAALPVNAPTMPRSGYIQSEIAKL